ncbi:MAG: hypothetical protein DRP27_07340 [Thermotogae bacterium]|nr:MAG: hypothetical protein DRP27_07340 [Thermotogota bacterium]
MPRSGVALIARPFFDKATSYGHYYMRFAVDYLRRRGWVVTDLEAGEATRENIFSALERDDPGFAYFLGHGNADIYSAQDREHVFRTCGENVRLIGRVVLFLSCSVGKRLGPDTANKGARAVFAWDVDFTWVAMEPPERDEYSRGFFEAVNAIAYGIADGLSAMEAFSRSLAVWDRWIDYWSGSDDPYASLVVMHLVHDRDGMRLFGEGGVRVAPPGVVAWVPMDWEMPLIMGYMALFFGLVA